jgi:hypothetical protein
LLHFTHHHQGYFDVARRHGTFYQLLLLILVLAVSSSLANIIHPLRSEALHRLQMAGSTCLILTCVGVAALLKDYALDGASESQSMRDSIGVLLMLGNAAFIVTCLCLMLRSGAGMARSFYSKARSFVSVSLGRR